MVKAVLFALFCFISTALCASAAVSVGFQANANISDNAVKNNGWHYRRVIVNQLLNNVLYTSIVADNDAKGSRANIVSGGVFNVAALTTYVGILNARDGAASNINSQGSAAASFGFAALTTGKLYEVDSNGNLVVASANITLNAFASGSLVQTDDGLSYRTYTYSDVKAGFTFSSTFLVSNRAGRTTYGNAFVTPTSIETVISISGYTFQSASNSLVLEMYAVSGNGDVKTGSGVYKGSTFSSEDSNGNNVYVSLASECYVGGSQTATPVTVTTASTSASIFSGLDATVYSLATAKYSGSNSIKAQIFSVKFPAGAGTKDNYIIYDPTTGSGTPPTQASTSSASSLSAYGFSVSILIALIFIMF